MASLPHPVAAHKTKPRAGGQPLPDDRSGRQTQGQDPYEYCVQAYVLAS